MAATPGQVGRLAAGAHSGTSGVAAFDTAQDQVKANRDAAVASLQQSAAQAGAPGALTAQLTGSIDAPAGVALNNLASLGAASGAQQQTMAQAVGNYTNEANQALPAITAQDNFDLSQKIGLLNAERAHAGGGGGGGGSLSDSELRSRLIGLATQYRMGQLQNLSQLEKLDEARSNQPVSYPGVAEVKIPGGYAEQAGISRAPYNPNATPAQVNANPYDAADAAYQKALQNVAQERVTVSQAQQNAYGPGLINDAQQIGLQAGIDPGTVYGILTPQDAQAYAAANQKLGLYKPPTVPVTDKQVLSAADAGKNLKLNPDEVSSALKTSYFDWDNNPDLHTKFAAWLNPKITPGAVGYDATLAKMTLAQQQKQFENSPDNHYLKANVVQNLVSDAEGAIKRGITYNGFLELVNQNAGYVNNPDPTRLGLNMVIPLFQAAQVSATQPIPSYTSSPAG